MPESLMQELRRLRLSVKRIKDCADPKCGSLCASCLRALLPPVALDIIPDVAEDDPVRTYRVSTARRR